MRGRTLAISAYLFLASLAAPALVVAQSPSSSSQQGTTPPPGAEAPSAAQEPSSGQPAPDPGSSALDPDASAPGSTAPADAATKPPAYDRKHNRKGGRKATAASSIKVKIADFKYHPNPVNVGVGDTVTWTNEDSEPHTATANNASFDTGTLDQGESGSHTFNKAGTFKYTCTIHPDMKASVVVGGGGGGGGSSGTSGSGGTSAPGTGTGLSGGTGSSSSLPSTGQNEVPLIAAGVVLLTLGLLLRRWFWARV